QPHTSRNLACLLAAPGSAGGIEMIALIAIGFAVLVGVVGLGIDLGFVAMNQRILKNASDASAIAGAIQMVATEPQYQPNVTTLLGKHALPSVQTNACDVVNQSNAVVQSGCAAGFPSTSSGIQVSLNYSRATFFMGLLGTPTMYNRTASIARPWAETSYN